MSRRLEVCIGTFSVDYRLALGAIYAENQCLLQVLVKTIFSTRISKILSHIK